MGSKKDEYRMTSRFLAQKIRQIMSPLTKIGKSRDRAASRRGYDQFGFGYVHLEVPIIKSHRDPQAVGYMGTMCKRNIAGDDDWGILIY